MRPFFRICWAAFFVIVETTPPSQAQTPQLAQPPGTALYRFEAAAENSAFEWFFLVVDAGTEQGIWAKHGLAPEFVPAAGSATQLKERVDSGVKLGFVNTAEVLLARSAGTPVKIVAGYFGETTARIFVAANGPIQTPKELDRKKIGIVATAHTSYRTILFMNERLGIRAEPVPLGSLQSNVAALKVGQIDAFYSAEGAALTLADSGDVRVLLPLADIYPKPYTAVVVWATDDLIENSPNLVARFVAATLETVAFLKTHPIYAATLYLKRTNASQPVAEKAIASLTQILAPLGRGSGQDLVAAVEGNWQFTVESGAVARDSAAKFEEAVDTKFLPPN
jgi:ABC-type nitrate/sulfonate/bicarbonate transport system substrate-binding protein